MNEATSERTDASTATSPPPPQPPATSTPRPQDAGRGCGILFGVFLILLGSGLFAARYFDIDVWTSFGRAMEWIPWEYAWTGFLLGPGAVMLLFGLFGSRQSAGLAIPGCVLTTIGLIMLGQALWDAWASWSYVWALIPASVGLGLFVLGLRTRESRTQKVGSVMLAVSLIAFVVLATFFEVLVGVGGFLPGEARRAVLPILVIAAGLFIVFSSRRTRSSGISPADPSDPLRPER
jgi:hypothetical protein